MRMSSPLQRVRHRKILARGPAAAAGGMLVVTCALLAAACGSTAAPGSGSASPAAIAKVSLKVTFAAAPATAARHYTLTCGPAGGSTPDPAAACRKLTTADLFGPKPAHVMCPMILAGSARATVSGTYLGKAVHETIVDGGCDLARYQHLKQIFN